MTRVNGESYRWMGTISLRSQPRSPRQCIGRGQGNTEACHMSNTTNIHTFSKPPPPNGRILMRLRILLTQAAMDTTATMVTLTPHTHRRKIQTRRDLKPRLRARSLPDKLQFRQHKLRTLRFMRNIVMVNIPGMYSFHLSIRMASRRMDSILGRVWDRMRVAEGMVDIQRNRPDTNMGAIKRMETARIPQKGGEWIFMVRILARAREGHMAAQGAN
mmetsp:Transcript_19866/g.31507  ORF Transcript_19866/g.31507 Transcript_19866/m.31507 type:complete len:216 (+) Transcript_19866:1555-2202(+)